MWFVRNKLKGTHRRRPNAPNFLTSDFTVQCSWAYMAFHFWEPSYILDSYACLTAIGAYYTSSYRAICALRFVLCPIFSATVGRLQEVVQRNTWIYRAFKFNWTGSASVDNWGPPGWCKRSPLITLWCSLINQVVTFDYGMREENPIDHVRFYLKSEPQKALKVRKDQVNVIVSKSLLMEVWQIIR